CLFGITVRVRGLAIPDLVAGGRRHAAEPENVSAAHVLVSSCMDREQHECQRVATKTVMRILSAQLGRFSITMCGGGRMADLTTRMIGAMQADVKTLTEIENDPSAFPQAVTVIFIAGIAALIGNIFRQGIGLGIVALISSFVFYGLFSFLCYAIGTKVMPEPT